MFWDEEAEIQKDMKYPTDATRHSLQLWGLKLDFWLVLFLLHCTGLEPFLNVPEGLII